MVMRGRGRAGKEIGSANGNAGMWCRGGARKKIKYGTGWEEGWREHNV